jgi:hypothetical protein
MTAYLNDGDGVVYGLAPIGMRRSIADITRYEPGFCTAEVTGIAG